MGLNISIRHSLLIVLMLFVLPGVAFAKGGDGEPSRCPHERGPGVGICDPGHQEFSGCAGSDCGCSSNRCFLITECGGAGQRACCTTEAGATRQCDSGLLEIARTPSCPESAGGCLCDDRTLPRERSSTTCIVPQPCGAVGQRACCPGEPAGPIAGAGRPTSAHFACPNSDASREVDGFLGYCGPGSPISGQPAVSRCEAVEPCGGPGERGCCLVGERLPLAISDSGACEIGLTEVSGCDSTLSSCTCGGTDAIISRDNHQSNGSCVATSPCGGAGQRGCCLTEERLNTTTGACQEGLTEVTNGCTGNCFCGGNVLQNGAVSTSTCVSLDPADFPIAEPETDCWPGSPGCPLRGYADMHVHMFGHLAHGGMGFVGKPYDAQGGVNAALRQDAWTKADRDLGGFTQQVVEKDGAPKPALNVDECIEMKRLSLDAGVHWTGSECRDSSGNRIVSWHGAHGPLFDTLGAGTFDMAGAVDALNIDSPLGPIGANAPFGAPAFNAWPTWTTTVHQQVYYKWLERAYQGGLRLMVMMAVNSEAACRTGDRLSDVNCRQSMLPPDRFDELDRYDDRFQLIPGQQAVRLPPIELQLQAAYEFEDWLTQQPGGGWFKIVRTPGEAREAIADGKLAVVLSIEVDHLFNCHAAGSGPDYPSGRPWDECTDDDVLADICQSRPACSEDDVLTGIDKYYEKGVRHVFPVHNFDNAFAGTATWINTLNIGNRAMEGHWWEVEECPEGIASLDPPGDDGYGLKISLDFIENSLLALGFPDFGFWCSADVFWYYVDCNLDPNQTCDNPPPDPPGCFSILREQQPQYANNGQATSCNARGLTPALGPILIKGMMDKGMLIDVDHMSIKSLNATLDLAEEEDYPLLASHGLFFELHNKFYNGEETGRHERLRTREQLLRLNDLGSLVSVMLKDDAQPDDLRTKQTLPYFPTTGMPVIRDDCRHSTKSWAQAYQYAVETLGGPVAVGSDWNGVAQHLGPRFGNQGCGGSATVFISDFDPDPDPDGSGPSLSRANERSAQEKAGNQLRYPFTLPGFGTFDKQTTGQKTFDFNYDGLAHIGLMPDMLGDLLQIGLREQDLDPLFRSAEAYVTLWEKADFSAGNADNTGPSARAECVNRTLEAGPNCQVSDVSIAHSDLAANGLIALSQSPSGPYGLNQTAVTLTATPDSSLSCEPPTTCTGVVTVQDTTGPSIICPANVIEECTGASSAPAAFDASIAADNCDPSPTSGCLPASGSVFSLAASPHSVSCSATDAANNSNSCNFQVAIRDTTPPTITTCPLAVSGLECTGNGGAPFHPAPATASDICAGVTVDDPPAGQFPVGTTALPYTATDEAGLADTCTSSVTVVDTTPPTITACPPAVSNVECTGGRGAPFSPAPATASDICAGVTVDNPPAGEFPVGATTLQYAATDEAGLADTCTSSVTVVDTTPPAIASVSAGPESLWPPNHKMRDVVVSVEVTDACDSGVRAPVCTITGITSNEPVNDLGDGNHAPDWEFTGGLTARLRSERSGLGTGREYTLEVTCADVEGNTTLGATIVTVPHDQSARSGEEREPGATRLAGLPVGA